MKLSKVIIFGAWREGISLFFEIYAKVEVVAFLDNNADIQSQNIYGIKILSLDNLNNVTYDEIYISSSKRYKEMYIQLIERGVRKDKIKIIFGSDRVKRDLLVYSAFSKKEIEKFEIEWSKLRVRFNKIQMYYLHASCIGELIPRLWPILEEESVLDGTVLRVFLPAIGMKRRICNKELIKLLEERIYLVTEDNIDFWQYVMDIHSMEIETLHYNQYLYRGELPNYLVQKDCVFIKFKETQMELGRKKLREMGVFGEYVCIMARNSNYAKKTLKDKQEMETNIAVHEFRNCDFYGYVKTIEYLKKIGIQTVRVGRGEDVIEDIDNCIDYAGKYADDFMDIFLMANCKLMIVGGGSGIFELASSFGRPVLLVNLVPYTFGCGGDCYTENDIYIPKKLMYKNGNSYLSLREVADVDKRSMHNGIIYDKNGVEFVDNTSIEILEAAKEILDRIDGKWRDTEDDIKLYQQYELILASLNCNLKKDIYKYLWGGGAVPRRIAASYLRKNLYLLSD